MNQKRYWLRGGIIFLVIGTIWFLLAIPIHQEKCVIPLPPEPFEPCNSGEPSGLSVYEIFTYPLRLAGLFFLLFDNMGFLTAMVLFVGQPIYWFFIGSILGWLYGKIKNRKSSEV